MNEKLNKMRKYIFIFIITFTIISCKSFKAGEYRNNLRSAIIIFNKDSTFSYSNYDCSYSSGTWQTKDNRIIILNSFIKNKIIPIEISSFRSKGSKEIIQVNINIITSNKNDKDYFCVAYRNNNKLLYDPTDSLKSLLYTKPLVDIQELSNSICAKNGSYTFNTNYPIDSICFKIWKYPININERLINDSLQTTTKGIRASLGDSLNINILLNDSLFGYEIFKNTKLKHINGRLIFRNNKFKHKK